MKKHSLKLLAILFATSAIVSCKDEDDTKTPVNNEVNYYATLKGSNEVPSNNSTATGSVSAIYNKDTKILTATINYSGLTVTAGHIHVGEVGVAGAVVFPFTITASPIKFTSDKLTDAQEADLIANRYYVNLHSAAFPGGEIRGQLYPANIVGFTADLKGSSEVPANASTATGMSVGIYNKDTKVFSITTTYSGLVVTAGHIHVADVGVSGPVVFPFANTGSPIVYSSPALDNSQETDLLSGHYYVNLHSAAFPNGEIRGQIMKQ